MLGKWRFGLHPSFKCLEGITILKHIFELLRPTMSFVWWRHLRLVKRTENGEKPSQYGKTPQTVEGCSSGTRAAQTRSQSAPTVSAAPRFALSIPRSSFILPTSPFILPPAQSSPESHSQLELPQRIRSHAAV